MSSKFKALKGFIGHGQAMVIAELMTGEEGEWFEQRMIELAAIIAGMPSTYGQRAIGDMAVAHLHYFGGCADCWVTEKDIDTDGEGQIQAFGMVDLGDGPEVGYVSLVELLAAGLELDLHWKPQTLRQIKDSL